MVGTEKIHRVYLVGRNVYICIAVSYMLLTTCAPLQLTVSWAVAAVYSIVPVFGLALIACGFILREIDISFPGVKALIAFLGVMVISCLVNYHYALVDNIKEILWMTISFFLLYCPAKNESLGQRSVFLLRLVVWESIAFGIMCAVSLGQYYVGYGATFQNPVSPGILRVGFVDGRLFGIFTDPNYASLAALLLIFGAAAAIKTRVYNRIISAICIISMVMQFAYLTLAGSRGATVCLFLALVFVGAFASGALLSKRMNGKRVVRVLLSLLLGVACSGFVFGIYTGVHFAEQQSAQAFQHALKANSGGQTAQDSKTNMNDSNKDSGSKATQSRPDTTANADISNNRFKIWNDAIAIWKTTPIVGATPRGYLDYANDTLGKIYIVERQYMLHNAFISVLTFNGVLGAVVIIAWLAILLFVIIRYLIRNNSKASNDYYIVLLFATGMLCMLVDSLVLTAIFYSSTFSDFLFWLFAGVAVFIASSKKDDGVWELIEETSAAQLQSPGGGEETGA